MSLLALTAALLATSCATARGEQLKDKRCAFIGLTNFSNFAQRPGPTNDEAVFLSPVIEAPIDWDELIVSWNVPAGVHLKAEARALYPGHTTQYYMMGQWSDDPARFPRQSLRRQRDEDGVVRTDTLILSNATRGVQVRLTIGGAGAFGVHPLGCLRPKNTLKGGHQTTRLPLKFLGLSFCNSAVPAPIEPPNHAAWGKVLDVPERRQGEYEGGGGWCSPTSLSMVLAYWAKRLHRPELNHTVPETAHAIADGQRGDTGDWPFNTAYAGHYPGMRAYVTRLGDIAELEDWIVAGIPVIISVSSYLTNDRTSGPDNGHLIVCVGFTDTGDVVANDPGVSVRRNVRARRVYAREKVAKAWKKSKNAVYLIYPETARIPANRRGHWSDQ